MELDIPFNSKTDRFETLSKILVHDSARNKIILQDITYELNNAKRVVIITERKEHIDSLYQYLKIVRSWVIGFRFCFRDSLIKDIVYSLSRSLN